MAKERVVGVVAGVNRDKGFFFICGPDGRDYFAWVRQLPDHRSLNTLVPQQTRIEFTPISPEPPKGPAASNLVVLEEPPKAPALEDAEVQPEDPTARRLGKRERRA